MDSVGLDFNARIGTNEIPQLNKDLGETENRLAGVSKATEQARIEQERFNKSRKDAAPAQSITNQTKGRFSLGNGARTAGGMFSGGARSLASMGSGDAMQSGMGMLGMAGQGMRAAGSALGGAGGAIGGLAAALGPAAIGVAAVAGGGMAVNALSKQYEQFAPLNTAAQLTGDLAVNDRDVSVSRFNEALDRATGSAAAFGVTIEQAGQLQQQAMRQADVGTITEAQDIADKILGFKNAYGASESGTMALESYGLRYGNQADSAATAIATHQLLVKQGKTKNATVDETVGSLNTLAGGQANKGIFSDMQSIAQGAAMLTSMKYDGSDQAYYMKDAAAVAGKLNQGFASAASLSQDTDVLAFQAARNLNIKNGKSTDVQEVRKTLERGFSGDPELMTSYMKELESLDETSRVNVVKNRFNTNYTQSEELLKQYDAYAANPDKAESFKMSPEMLQIVKDAEAAKNPMQEMVSSNQQIRNIVAKIGEGMAPIKEGFLRMLAGMGDEDAKLALGRSKHGDIEKAFKDLPKLEFKRDVAEQNRAGLHKDIVGKGFFGSNSESEKDFLAKPFMMGKQALAEFKRAKKSGQIDNDGTIDLDEKIWLRELFNKLARSLDDAAESKRDYIDQTRAKINADNMIGSN